MSTPTLTRDEILRMEAGPELDALVAEHVMGWTFLPLPPHNQYGLCRHCGRALPDDPQSRQEERGVCFDLECAYSDGMGQAWPALERARAALLSAAAGESIVASVEFDERACCEIDVDGVVVASAYAATPQLALCRAALLSKLEDPR